MTQRRSRRISNAVPVLALIGWLLAGCSQPAAPTQAAPSGPTGPRPASPAKVEILQPTANSTVTGSTVHIVLKLTGATIVQQTTTAIKPDEGHVHLYVNNVLVSMNYGLEQDIPVQPGPIDLKAEFVAADHYPFNPRVWSPDVIFTVHQ